MTRFLQRALLGVPASADEWNDHLKAFHATFPCCTPAMIDAFTDDCGERPYQAFARYAHERAPGAASVLDVGCGSGELLAELHRLYGEDLILAGLDFSERDALCAQARLPGATIQCVDAADCINGRFDLVVSHLMLRSAANLKAVLRNMRNALNDRGRLAFAVEDFEHPDSMVTFIWRVFTLLRERFPQASLQIPGREPFETAEMMKTLLGSFGYVETSIESRNFSARLQTAEIVEFALLAYPFGLLEPPIKDELRQVALSEAASATKDGAVLVNFPVKFVTALAG